MGVGEVLLAALAVVAAVVLACLVIVFLIVPVFKAASWVIAQLWRFAIGEIGDAFRLLGSLILAILYVPVILGSLVIGRWSASGHYGRALLSELSTAGLCIYRIAIGHPLRLFKAEGLVEGIEQRLPAVVANAPTSDVPAGGRAGQFAGYQIQGSLAPGGSGAKLYIASPDAGKRSLFARQGFGDIPQVVIKTFSTSDGSSLPQIVRESRSLDAAKRLGLILDHELAPERFFYVMRYVPGEPLSMVTKNLHAGSPAGGLGDAQLRSALGYVSDLVATLASYHRGGLWHKDVKPDNIIVDTAGRAHLVDFGLITSLRSAMTLTTHGTEYFRDPEMVRLALRGVKVHEVDGTRFDVYGAGAVLYAVIEDGFPAHGALSQVRKRCPEAVKWIVRRAMTDYDKRYVSAEAMLADLSTVANAADPFAVRPADLPSMQDAFGPISGDDEAPIHRAAVPSPALTPHAIPVAAAVVTPGVAHVAPAAGPTPTQMPPPMPHRGRRTAPAIRVLNWWSGRSQAEAGQPIAGNADDVAAAAHAVAGGSLGVAHAVLQGGARSPIPPASPGSHRRAAADHVAMAQARVEAARARAMANSHARVAGKANRGWNGGVLVAVMILLGTFVGITIKTLDKSPEIDPGAEASVTVSDITPPEAIGEIATVERALARAHQRIQNAGVAPTLTSSGTLLVVCDILQPWSEHASDFLGELADELDEAGFDLAGMPLSGAPAASESRDVLAAARLALGQFPTDSQEASDALRKFLESNSDQFDGVIWVSPAPGSTDETPRVLVVTRQSGSDSLSGERSDAARAAVRRATDAVRPADNRR